MALARLKNDSTSGRVPTGFADEIVITDSVFREAHRAHERNHEPPSKKRKREARGDSSVVFGAGAYKGPWAKFEDIQPDARPSNDRGLASDEEEVEEVEEVSEYEEDAIPSHALSAPSKAGTAYSALSDAQEMSAFLGSEQYNYLGKTYMHIPRDLGINLTGELPPYHERKNYSPKKLIHTWKDPRSSHGKAHERAITQTRFFPDSGHLLLSAGADSKVLLWDVYHERSILRSYNGHTKSVCDIDFTPDGTQFVSASYDRSIKAWDTETGTCSARFPQGAVPHVVRVNPALPHEFIAGMSNNKILQFDLRSDDKKPVQEYDHHLSNINTLTFCDESRRFLSTSDDKSIRAWEYGIPVPIKIISEPHMYALTKSSAHPSGKYIAFQSGDNEIVVYSSTEKFRQNRKKSFRAHNNSGYAIDVAISPAGDLVGSGSSDGFVYFWDWKSCRLYHKMQASVDGAVVAMGWNPRASSRVVTGDSSGALKYWD